MRLDIFNTAKALVQQIETTAKTEQEVREHIQSELPFCEVSFRSSGTIGLYDTRKDIPREEYYSNLSEEDSEKYPHHSNGPRRDWYIPFHGDIRS